MKKRSKFTVLQLIIFCSTILLFVGNLPLRVHATLTTQQQSSIENIDLTNVNIDPEVGKIEIDDNAFDASVTTIVNVYTSDEVAWSDEFGAINKNFVFK